MTKKVSKAKKKKETDLIFYLDFYKELSSRSETMRKILDLEIDEMVEELKRME